VPFYWSFPPRDEAIMLSPKELGLHALPWLLQLEGENPNVLHRKHFISLVLQQELGRQPNAQPVRSSDHAFNSDPQYAQDLGRMWQSLLEAGFIARDERQQSADYIVITPLARQVVADPSFADRLRAVELLNRSLHPQLEKARQTFEGGDFDTAIHQAFKAVEVAVRAGGGFPNTTIGVDLVTQAFKPDSGPLADTAAPTAEQEGVMQLFRGGFAAYRNPASHRDLVLDDLEEAAEIVLFADLLIRITERAANRP
jgi:uncharacterized protein (TIGR02391 family)